MELTAVLYWIREREQIRIRKDRGERFPWTRDSVLTKYRFCNVRREDDSVTQWIRDNIRRPFHNSPYLWFMLCAARQINWPDTLAELIGERDAWPTPDNGFSPSIMADVLEERARRGDKVFTGAYTITAPSVKGNRKTYFVAEKTLGNLWRARGLFDQLFRDRQPTLKAVHAALLKYPAWGNFMSYQAVVDMRFTDLLSSADDRYTWAAAGPGTIRGLNRIYNRPVKKSMRQEQALDEMLALDAHLAGETDIRFDFSDIPNILCETDKWLRVRNGEGAPRALYVPARGA